MRWSIWATRELIVASALRESFISPSRTCATNSFTMSRPRSRATCSFPNRPCSTIWSNRLDSVVLASADWAAAFSGLLIRASLGLILREFFLQLIGLLSIADGFHQKVVELIVTLKCATEIAELLAEVKKLAQRFDVLGDTGGVKVIQTLEVYVHLELTGVGFIAEFVVNLKREMRLEALQHAIKVVWVDLYKAAVLELR